MALPALRSLRGPGLSYRRLVVPLAAGPESETAMEIASELADEHGATISAVVVIEVPKQLPLDAHMLEEESDARKLLEEARAIGARRGVAVRARVLLARGAGEAIVGEAKDGGADIIVLRAPRSGWRRRVFGKTAAYVLQHAPCRVLVVSPPPP
jgi:universal stress protein F